MKREEEYKKWLTLNECEDAPDKRAAFMLHKDPCEAEKMYAELGKNAREMTIMCHPCKMTVGEFINEITKSAEAFAKNMDKLKGPDCQEFAEVWMNTLASWVEMESDSPRGESS